MEADFKEMHMRCRLGRREEEVERGKGRSKRKKGRKRELKGREGEGNFRVSRKWLRAGRVERKRGIYVKQTQIGKIRKTNTEKGLGI